jgi:hypothetical protein
MISGLEWDTPPSGKGPPQILFGYLLLANHFLPPKKMKSLLHDSNDRLFFDYRAMLAQPNSARKAARREFHFIYIGYGTNPEMGLRSGSAG